MNKPEIAKLTENVYRTKDYIVKQVLYVLMNIEENNAVVSVDTFYRRTIVRDSRYIMQFKIRTHIDGKRLPSNMYVRTYVDCISSKV